MNTAANAGEVFDDSDQEMDEETRERHKEFERKREAHYSKEAAFAMRKARELLNEEEADEDEGEGEDADDSVFMPVAVDGVHKSNGTAR